MSALPSDNNSDKTKRYARKRELILDVATDLINEMGVKGMTFVDVAQRVELNTTSITYYFKRKELLAEAVFERSIDRMEEAVLKAAKQPDPARAFRLILSTPSKNGRASGGARSGPGAAL